MNLAGLTSEISARIEDGFNHPEALIVIGLALASAVVAFIIVLIATDARSTARAVRRLRRINAAAPHVRRVERVSAALGISTEIVAGGAASAFTHGLLRPCVVVTESLASALSDDELEAVLRHERAHQRSMDPLRLMVVRSLVTVLAPVPFVHGLLRAYTCRRELRADNRTVREMSSARPLLSALRRVIDASLLMEGHTVAGLTQLDVRIDRLAGIATPLRALVEPPSRRQLAAFGATLILAALLMLASAHSVNACLAQVAASC